MIDQPLARRDFATAHRLDEERDRQAARVATSGEVRLPPLAALADAWGARSREQESDPRG